MSPADDAEDSWLERLAETADDSLARDEAIELPSELALLVTDSITLEALLTRELVTEASELDDEPLELTAEDKTEFAEDTTPPDSELCA